MGVSNVQIILIVLTICALIGKNIHFYLQHSIPNINKSTEFKRFQRNFVALFLVMMGADWMQGPYFYEIYDSYGYTHPEIMQLFLVGFTTAGFLGPVIGAFCDRFGRKFTCLLYSLIYSLSCAMFHFRNYIILVLSRFLGGIATAILYSAFEAWMVTKHNSSGFPMNLLGETFNWAWGWNGLVAVSAAVITQFVVNKLPFGYVGAFDCSLLTLLLGSIMIFVTWDENYGESNLAVCNTLGDSFNVCFNDSHIILVGAINAVFEAGMFLFVFEWTPALKNLGQELAHGFIFANFMLCCVLGTDLFKFVNRFFSVELLIIFIFMLAAMTMFMVTIWNHFEIRLYMFLLFELCVGMYWPAIGILRARYVPDNKRGTLMNIFRIPLNTIVIAGLLLDMLLGIGVLGTLQMCAALHCVAVIFALLLWIMTKTSSKKYLKMIKSKNVVS